MTRPEDILQRLYEDTGWREDLTDAEANQLLSWAERKLYQVDAQAAAESDFEAKVENVQRVLRKINKFVGRRGSLTAEEQQATLNEIAALSDVAGIQTSDLTPQTFSAQAAPHNTTLLRSLTEWLDTGEKPSPDSLIQAQAAEPEPIIEEEAPPKPPMQATDMSAFMNFFTADPEPAPAPEPLEAQAAVEETAQHIEAQEVTPEEATPKLPELPPLPDEETGDEPPAHPSLDDMIATTGDTIASTLSNAILGIFGDRNATSDENHDEEAVDDEDEVQ